MASLGNDLAAIRKEQDLSLEDVQNATKLAPAVLESIENDSIFDEMNTNTTYVRSYVRNYAKAVKVDSDEIIQALNEVEADQYSGGIRKENEHIEEDKKELKDTGDEEVLNDSEEMIHDHSPEYSINKPAAKSNITEEINSGSVSSFNWANIGNKTAQTETNSAIPGKWMFIILLICLTVIAVVLYSYFSGNAAENENVTPTTEVEQPIIPADSLQEALLAEQNTQAVVTARTLPDTLTMTVIAASGKLEPVRVYTDIMGIRRPYWIELHDTMRFNFVDVFRVRATEQYERMKLVFNGYEIENYFENFYNTETEMVILGRSEIENHPEWKAPAE